MGGGAISEVGVSAVATDSALGSAAAAVREALGVAAAVVPRVAFSSSWASLFSCASNSLEASCRLRRVLASVRPISGSLRGPKTKRATAKMTNISGSPTPKKFMSLGRVRFGRDPFPRLTFSRRGLQVTAGSPHLSDGSGVLLSAHPGQPLPGRPSQNGRIASLINQCPSLA